jgi:hypothetical protein
MECIKDMVALNVVNSKKIPLKTVAASSSEISVSMYRRTRCHNPGDYNFYEKLISMFSLAILLMVGQQAFRFAVKRSTAGVQ